MLPQTGYQGCQIPEDITGSNWYSLSQATKMRRRLGKAGVSHTRTIRPFRGRGGYVTVF